LLEEMMIPPMLSTKDDPRRYGGLLICGTNPNSGREPPDPDEKSFEPWAEYFTHSSNRDNFTSRLIDWFKWWDIPLELTDGTPTELNHAISQTNLFYDSSKNFELRPPPEMESAYKRLQETLASLNISGLLITSAQLVAETRCRLFLPEWRKIGAGRFWVHFASSTSLRVAVCPHPSPYQSKDDVKMAGCEMRTWIDETLREYRKKQAAQSPRS
jgi:hypothetical protein